MPAISAAWPEAIFLEIAFQITCYGFMIRPISGTGRPTLRNRQGLDNQPADDSNLAWQ
jgi:hypothetical protein